MEWPIVESDDAPRLTITDAQFGVLYKRGYRTFAAFWPAYAPMYAEDAHGVVMLGDSQSFTLPLCDEEFDYDRLTDLTPREDAGEAIFEGMYRAADEFGYRLSLDDENRFLLTPRT